MYTPTGYRYPFAPTPRGMGQILQTAPCPSMAQLLGIPDPTDPCQAGGTVSTANNAGCYNVATGTYQTCPVSGSTTTVGPSSSQGPFGLPINFQWNWAVLALVALGLVVLGGAVGGGRR